MLARVEPLDRDIELLIRQDLSPEAQSAALARFARDTLAEVASSNTQVLGHRPRHETVVDGAIGALEDSVGPEGTIVYAFELIVETLGWIAAQLEQHSPVARGRDPQPAVAYRRSHIFYADGAEADAFNPPPDLSVGTFINAVPYARKIEAGDSSQAPDGVYEVVTALASRRFGNLARVQFGYRAAMGGRTLGGLSGNRSGVRQPAIIVTVK